MLQLFGEAMVRKRKFSAELVDLTTIQRTTKIVACLMGGESLTVPEVCAMTGLTRQGAEKHLAIISSVLHVYDDRGVWQISDLKELE